VAAVAALAAMAVHARRINPFGRAGQWIRRLTDPLLVPIERRLLRTRFDPRYAPGGSSASPSSAASSF